MKRIRKIERYIDRKGRKKSVDSDIDEKLNERMNWMNSKGNEFIVDSTYKIDSIGILS